MVFIEFRGDFGGIGAFTLWIPAIVLMLAYNPANAARLWFAGH
jgi:hypothetical protein